MRCADLRKRKSLTSETALGGRCRFTLAGWTHPGYQGLRPELTERQDPGPILKAVGILAGIEDDGFLQAGAESLFQEAQAVQVFTANAGSCLDLEADDLAVVALEDEVYLVAALDRKSTRLNSSHT